MNWNVKKLKSFGNLNIVPLQKIYVPRHRQWEYFSGDMQSYEVDPMSLVVRGYELKDRRGKRPVSNKARYQ